MNDKTLKALRQLAESLAEEETLLKEAGSSHSAQRLHGDTGLFSVCGLDRRVVTAHMRSKGLAAELPWFPSNSEDPRFGIITGVSDDIGSEPTDVCEDAPTGYVKACNLTARFGVIRRDTETIDMTKVSLRKNRGDFTDLVMYGQMLGLTNLEPSGMNDGEILNIITMAEMVQTGVRAERLLVNWTWQGTAANQNEFPGLDVQIATGQIDADTSTTCPAADSYVDDYGFEELDATIVNAIGDMEYSLTRRARRMELDPATWVICMRPEMWKLVSEIWPIAYNTNRGSYAETNGVVNVMGDQMVAERDRMRRSMTIDINGNTYPVVEDDGIYEHTPSNTQSLEAGEFASSIYMVPKRITGGLPVSYFQYVDFRGAQPDVSLLRGMQDFFWTDQGRYSWAIENQKWCYKLALVQKPRVILRTPHLAGRIDDIKIAPRVHLRDSSPDSDYWVDGGNSLRGGVGDPVAIWAP